MEWNSNDVDGNPIYHCDVPMTGDLTTYPNVIFCRMNPASTDLGWGSKWNQTNDQNGYSVGKIYYV